MPDSPAARTPYEVLGVAATASDDEVKKAYRRLLRQTHPDTGGDAVRFHAVQLAWESIGTAEARSDYDRGRSSAGSAPSAARSAGSTGWGPSSGASGRSASASAVKARSYGHPGGRARERYLTLLREWVGRGVEIDDPFDPALVRSAPREIRSWLGKAVAEEETARSVTGLGIAYTIWNDVAAGRHGDKIDHVVLGPAGLFAITSADWGDVVRLKKNEVVGESVHEDDRPFHVLGGLARAFGRSLGVRVRALVVVVPDEDLAEPYEVIERGRNSGSVLIRRSLLPQLLRTGFGDGSASGGYGESFEVRTRVQNGARFV